jgi:hypothetical protein
VLRPKKHPNSTIDPLLATNSLLASSVNMVCSHGSIIPGILAGSITWRFRRASRTIAAPGL